MITIRRAIVSFCLTLVMPLSYAEEPLKETAWLKAEAGYEGGKLGARVDSVTEMNKEGLQRIKISLPDPGKTIEEVVVIGKREDVIINVPQKKRFEIINDPETGRSGIIIYLGKRQQFALKFNYYDGNSNFPE